MTDLNTRVRSMIAQILRVDLDRIVDAARLEADLKADHLDIVDLVMEFEDRFEITVTDGEMEAIVTVGDIIALAQPAAVAQAA